MSYVVAADVTKHVDTTKFLAEAAAAVSVVQVKSLLMRLPIVPESDYDVDVEDPAKGWREGFLHWYPVGRDRGNAGRIKLAPKPETPIAERVVNGAEAIIEMMRKRELQFGTSPPAASPREAVLRYFGLPPLDQLPLIDSEIRGVRADKLARELARKIRVRLILQPSKEAAVIIEDDGIGQTPARVHKSLLSLGSSDKGDKPYLIGLFGQGGSSTYQASDHSWVMSRRAPDLLDSEADGVSWTVVKLIQRKGRRDPYYAYLAGHPDGRVPAFPASAADVIGFAHGTRFAHLNYNFGPSRAEIARELYPALNHLLFNPVLPYELYTRPAPHSPDPMYGNGYRLRKLPRQKKPLDKTFDPQPIQVAGGIAQ